MKQMTKMENTLEQEKNNVSSLKKKFDWEKASQIATVFSSISVIIAVVTLAISMYPQLIWKNTNYVEKANAGDVYSQMFLAEHYYEIGDYNESVYWYKIAAMADSEYQAYAYNNLGILYAEGYGISDDVSDGYRRYEQSLKLFQNASAIDEKFKDNIWLLLKGNSKECFPNVNYDNLVAQLQFDEASVVESSYYEYREITMGHVFWEDNKKYTYSGLVTIPSTDGISRSRYMYYVQVYRDDSTPLPDYYFAYLEN